MVFIFIYKRVMIMNFSGFFIVFIKIVYYLVKLMMVVVFDGYIISVLGLYLLDYYNNDVSIIKYMIL